MMLRCILLLAGAWCVLAPACSLQAHPQVRARPAFMSQLKAFEQNPLVTRAVLRNGLTVLVNESHAAPVVSFAVHVKTGYAQDPAGLSGMAGLVQRMLLSRVETGGGGRLLWEDVRTLGGELLGFTEAQRTSFSLTVPAAQWRKAVEHLGQLLVIPTWDEERLRRQITHLRAEERFRYRTPAMASREMLLELLLGKERSASWNPAGPAATGEFTLDAVRKHYEAEYRAAAVTVVVSGALVAAEVLNEVVKIFAKIPSGTGGAGLPTQAAVRDGFRYAQVTGAAEGARVLAGFRIPVPGAADYSAIEVMRAILATGERSVLARSLRDEKKSIRRFSSELLSYPGGGILVLDMETDMDSMDRAEIALFTELELLKRSEPTAEQMERAYAQLEVAHWSALQTAAQRAERLSYLEARGAWKDLQSYPSAVRKVRPADVSAAAKKYLGLASCAIVEYLPLGGGSRNMSAEMLLDILNTLLEESVREELVKREKSTKPAYSIPARRPASSLSEIRYPFRKASVLRGPELYIREDRSLPLVHIGFFYPGGRLMESHEKRGITDLMLRSLLGRQNADDKPDPLLQLEIYGGILQPVIERDYFGAYLTLPSLWVEEGLDLFLGLIKATGFEEESVERQKALLAAELHADSCIDETYPARRLKEMLFGGHPYGVDAAGVAQTIGAMDHASVRDWYRKTVENRLPIVVIAGDTRGTSLASYFVRNFSGSRYAASEMPEDFPDRQEQPGRIVEDWQETFSAVAMGFMLPPWGDEDLYSLALIREQLDTSAGLLGSAGGSGSEVGPALVAHGVELRVRGSILTVVARTAPGSEQAVLEVLRKQMEDLGSKQLLYRDYRTMLNAAEGEFWIRQQSRRAQAAELVLNVLAGRDLEEMQDYPSRLREVTADDFQEAAVRFLKPARAAELILRGSGGTAGEK